MGSGLRTICDSVILLVFGYFKAVSIDASDQFKLVKKKGHVVFAKYVLEISIKIYDFLDSCHNCSTSLTKSRSEIEVTYAECPATFSCRALMADSFGTRPSKSPITCR